MNKMKNAVNLTLSKRNQRKQFCSEVGLRIYNIVRDIGMGHETSTIAKRYHVSAARVAAVRANFTRGAYSPYVFLNGRNQTVGLCGFNQNRR